jgi:hypothetical protein
VFSNYVCIVLSDTHSVTLQRHVTVLRYTDYSLVITLTSRTNFTVTFPGCYLHQGASKSQSARTTRSGRQEDPRPVHIMSRYTDYSLAITLPYRTGRETNLFSNDSIAKKY